MFNFFQPKVPQVEANEIKRVIDVQEDFLLIDVRTHEEYAEGHIQGSRLMPLKNLNKYVISLTDKSKKLYVYCRSGSRSTQAVMLLQQLGFTNVYNMSGGLLTWNAKGFPITK